MVDSTHISRKVAEALALAEVGVQYENIREWTQRLRRHTAEAGTAHHDILRCIFGNPFRPLATPSLLSDSVAKIAQAIYDERSFERMLILADALEECGVSDSELLAHCRSGGPHARGCFALDLILGKS